MTDAERIAEILARLDPREREIWLETGRRLLRGELSVETAADWAHAQVARLAALGDKVKAPAGPLSSTF